MPGVYCISNLLNGKRYVGISVNVKQRYAEHKAGKSPAKLRAAIQKYGAENFVFEPIYYSMTGSDHLPHVEATLIEYFQCFGKAGYNVLLADGRVGPYGEEHRLSVIAAHQRPEVKAKVLAAAKRRSESQEFREACSASRRTPEMRAIASANGRVAWATDEARRSATRSEMLKKNSDPSFGEKRSAVMKSDAYRQKMAAAVTGLIWVTDGDASLRMRADEPIPEGWNRGRGARSREKISEAMKRLHSS